MFYPLLHFLFLFDSGRVWLFYGSANKDSILYNNEFVSSHTPKRITLSLLNFYSVLITTIGCTAIQKLIKSSYPNQFGYIYALIRGEASKEGNKLYIHDKMASYANDIYDRLTNNDAHIYYSGLEEMMGGIEDLFSKICQSKGVEYEEWRKQLELNGQWHIQVSSCGNFQRGFSSCIIIHILNRFIRSNLLCDKFAPNKKIR